MEDDVDVADAMAMALEFLGHQVEVAHDGASALEVVERMVPDVVLVDIGLPVLDGFEVARRIRASPHGAAITLVALTGYGRQEDKDRSKAAGFDDHLTKPIDLTALGDLFGRFAPGT